MSKEKTDEDVRKEFMRIVVEWCVDVVTDGKKTKEEAVLSAVFGVMTTLEGAGSFPYCAVIPQPHPRDVEFYKKHGKDWYPCPAVEQEAADFSVLRGEDHHMFVAMFKERMNQLRSNIQEETKA